MTYFHKTPPIVRHIFPRLLWKKKEGGKNLYLTFDDGPVPEATPYVLDILDKFKIKATFFCVGDNIKKYPEIFKKLVEAGHSIGNHTFNHLNGWKTSTPEYISNVDQCREIMIRHGVNNIFLRPPYGKITHEQIRLLKKRYKVVMWDVLSGDFDPELSNEDCLKNSIEATSDGSIIVFHDSVKAIEKVRAVLPLYIEHFQKEEFNFMPL